MFILFTLVMFLLKNIVVVRSAKIDVSSYSAASSFNITNGELASDSVDYPEFYPGDLNGDGFDDLLLVDSATQTLYILYGQENMPDIVLNRDDWNSANGMYFDLDSPISSIIFLDDFNNDSYDDVIVSYASCSPLGRTDAGCSYIITGQATSYTTTNITAAAFVTIIGAEDEASGNYLAPLGDINQDGFQDIVIGTGSSINYLLYGTANNQTIDLANFTESQGFTVTKSHYWTTFGTPAGDFNQDGFNDILFGYLCGGDVPCATIYLMFGQPSFPGSISLDELNGQPGVFINSTVSPFWTLTPAAAGDINNDGYADLIISGLQENGTVQQVTVFLIYGKAFTSDSVTIIDLASLSPTEGIKIPTGSSYPYSQGSMGNINYDDYDDFYIVLNDLTYIVYGGASLNATIDLNTLTAEDGLVIASGDSGSFRVVGDVDQDGQTEYALVKNINGTDYSDVYKFVSVEESQAPTTAPTLTPATTTAPTATPTTAIPTKSPTAAPTTAVPTRSPTFTPTSAPTVAGGASTDGSSDSNDSSSVLSTGGIVGIAIGGAAALVLFIAGVAYYLRRGTYTNTTGQVGKRNYSSVHRKESSDIEMNRSKIIINFSDEEMYI